jgi:hypothetical protein
VDRAEWHLADLTNSDDPFGIVLFSTGITVDVTATEDELAQACVKLLYKEAELARRGIRCEYKDAGQDCLDCPHATLDLKEDRSLLCRVGKDERAVETRYLALRAQRDPYDELAAALDAATELGHLADELAELLTYHGL